MTEEQIAELRAKYGRVKVIHMHGHTVVFRPPARHEIHEHMTRKESADPAIRALADENTLQFMVVSVDGKDLAPSKEAWQQFLTERPYFCSSVPVVKAFSELAGLVEDAEGKS